MGGPSEPEDLSVTLQPGTLIGEHYQVVKLLGQGGMGAVLLVQDRMLGRYLALKVLRPEMSERLESDAHFRQEARMLSRLSHPNIVTIHSFGTTADGMNYITMEYVEGRTLEDLALDPQVLAHVIQQVCNGLAEAHSRGIVHRDIKPANILLTSVAGVSHFAKVVDFGLAQIREEHGDGQRPITLTQENKVVGTPAYMSPEQAMGRSVDARSDIYSLGVVALEMLTGALPFEADTHFQMLSAHCREPPALPSALKPEAGFEVDGPMDTFIARALRKAPGQALPQHRGLRPRLRQRRRAMARHGAHREPERDLVPIRAHERRRRVHRRRRDDDQPRGRRRGRRERRSAPGDGLNVDTTTISGNSYDDNSTGSIVLQNVAPNALADEADGEVTTMGAGEALGTLKEANDMDGFGMGSEVGIVLQ
jgi:serine/threonine protein kinase